MKSADRGAIIYARMSKNARRRRRTRAEITRAHRNTTAGIIRDYLTVHFWPDHVVTYEATDDGRYVFCVRDRADRRTVYALSVDVLVLEVHEGRLHKLADPLAYLQVAHHLRTLGGVPLRINGRCELCDADTGRPIALPPGTVAGHGQKPATRRA